MTSTSAIVGLGNLPSTSTSAEAFVAMLGFALIAAAAAFFIVRRRTA